MTIGNNLKAAALQAGVHAPKEITAHMFRRFYLEYALDNGMSVYVAAAIAGHATIQITADYGGGASLEATTRAVRSTSFPRMPCRPSTTRSSRGGSIRERA
jgi:integrase